MTTDMLILFASGICVAAASGFVGSFLLLRRMTLLTDALSHVALPGIALGVLFHFEPLAGGLAFLFIAILIVWGIEDRTRLAVESIVGVLFVSALAVGALLMPDTELLETFFGSVEAITVQSALIQTGLALAVLGVARRFLHPLVLSSIAPELAAAERINPRRMQLLLLSLIALTIAIGISFVGILLMSGLSIIPAATARNFSTSYRRFLMLSVAIAVVSLVAGLAAHLLWGVNSGSATVLVGTFCFIASLFARRRT
jgi:ABC-type Mn2+/Zn2+ transport system permease subunit